MSDKQVNKTEYDKGLLSGVAGIALKIATQATYSLIDSRKKR